MRKPRSVFGAAALPLRRRWFAAICLPLLILAVSAAAPTAGATGVGPGAGPLGLQATRTVTKTADTNDGTCDADCSLREAIAAAAASGDTIVFDGSLAGGTITLSGSQLTITKSVDIDASGLLPANIAVSGGGTLRVFFVGSGHTVNMTNLTITNGIADDGGGIRNEGTLSLTQCTVSNNVATTSAGGGISSVGSSSLTLTSVTFSGNTGDGGGAVAFLGTTAVVNGCTFSGNTTTGGGSGGAIILVSGTLDVVNSTFSGNSATGGNGGAITVAGGALSLSSSTLSGNSSASGGSGLNRSGSGTITTVRNSIVANNTGGSGNCGGGSITNGGNNIDSGTSCGWTTINDSKSSTDPLLTALGNFGGPTQTMALKSGSPGINGVTYNAPNGSPTTDQRGAARPQGALHDIGAYERAANGAVQLVRFEARRSGPAVALRWETAGEIKHAGFRVLREEMGGQLTDLTPRLIRPASPGGELGGAAYTFTDQAAPRVATRYWLEDADTTGRATRHGPAVAPAYRRPISLPFPPGGVTDGQVDPQAPQTEEVLP